MIFYQVSNFFLHEALVVAPLGVRGVANFICYVKCFFWKRSFKVDLLNINNFSGGFSRFFKKIKSNQYEIFGKFEKSKNFGNSEKIWSF